MALGSQFIAVHAGIRSGERALPPELPFRPRRIAIAHFLEVHAAA